MSDDPRRVPLYGIEDPHDPSVEWSAGGGALWVKTERGGEWRRPEWGEFFPTDERRALFDQLLGADPIKPRPVEVNPFSRSR